MSENARSRRGNQPRRGTKAFNVAVVRRLFQDLYNQGYFTQIERIQDIIGPEFQDLGPNSPRVGQGPRAFAACNEQMAFIPGENPRWTIDEIIAEGNKVVVRWTARKSEHTSSGISIYTINREGQINGAFTEWNALSILRSAGSLPEGLGES